MVIRLDYEAASREGMAALGSVHRHVVECGLEHRLLELINLRISYLNGVGSIELRFCADKRIASSPRQRDLLDRLPEANAFTDRERAALRWVDSLTRIDGEPEDEMCAEMRRHFDDRELVDLTIAIGLMNALDRLAIGFGRTSA